MADATAVFRNDAVTDQTGFVLYLWSYRAVYLGVSPENDLHRHHAAQLCIGLEALLRVREAKNAEWFHTRAVLVPPDRPHEIDAGTGAIITIYWEPESDDYPFKELGPTLRTFPLSTEAVSVLASIGDTTPDPSDVWTRCGSALGLQRYRAPEAVDPRVAVVLERIRQSPEQPHTLGSLAISVHLSPSRLSHLFSAQVGVALRRFIVWSRVRQAVRHALAGANLTQAAHAAGFADAAHMSHSFRGMFGFAPSALFAHGINRRVFVVDDVA